MGDGFVYECSGKNKIKLLEVFAGCNSVLWGTSKKAHVNEFTMPFVLEGLRERSSCLVPMFAREGRMEAPRDGEEN